MSNRILQNQSFRLGLLQAYPFFAVCVAIALCIWAGKNFISDFPINKDALSDFINFEAVVVTFGIPLTNDYLLRFGDKYGPNATNYIKQKLHFKLLPYLALLILFHLTVIFCLPAEPSGRTWFVIQLLMLATTLVTGSWLIAFAHDLFENANPNHLLNSIHAEIQKELSNL